MVFDSLSEPPVTAEMRSWERGTEGPWLQSLCSSVQLSSGAQSCPTLCDPVDRSTPGLPVHHQLPQSKVPFPFSALGSRGSPGTHQAVRHKLGPLLLTEPCQREGSALRSQEMRPVTVRGGRLETSPGPCTCSAVVPLSPLPSFPLLLHSSLRLSLLAPGSLLFLILFPSPSSFSLSRFHSFCTHSSSTYYVPGPL